MIILASTRFNDDTWNENVDYRFKHKMEGCIYGVPQEITKKIDHHGILLVVEMNNTKNRIEGIGLIQNKIQLDKYFRIYNTCDYNRYIYKSNYRVDREEIMRYNALLVNLLDYILFKERTHLKRGSGITVIPAKLCKHPKCENIDLKKEIKDLFIKMHHPPEIKDENETKG